MAERVNFGTMGFNNQMVGDFEEIQQMPAYTPPAPRYNEGIETLVNTYSPPTDIQAQAAEQRTRASQVSTPAQNLANQQANAFNQLLVNAGVIAPPEVTDPPPDDDDNVTDPPPGEGFTNWWEPFGYANEQEAIASGLFEFNSDLGIWIMTPPEFVGTSTLGVSSENERAIGRADEEAAANQPVDTGNSLISGGVIPMNTTPVMTEPDPVRSVPDPMLDQVNTLNLLDPTILDAFTTTQIQQPVQALDVPVQLNEPVGLESLVAQNTLPVFDTQIPTTFAARDPMLVNPRER
jgi:hypothetical protein